MTASLSSAELIPLGLLFLPLVLLVGVAIWAPRATTVDKEVVVRALPSDWIRQFVAEVEERGGYQLTASEQAHAIEVTRGRVPVWALVVAILLFPVGLLALLAFRKDKATVSARPAGDGSTRVRIVGTMRNQLLEMVDQVSEPLPL